MMVNVRIVTTMTVGGGGIVHGILPTEMMRGMVIQGAMTMRGEMITKNRRERGVVNRKNTISSTVVVVKGRQRVKR